MSRDFGFFLVVLGVFFILLQTSFWKKIFIIPFIPPVILILFGLAFISIGLFQSLRPFSPLIAWLFVMSIILFFMVQGFSFSDWQSSLSLNEYYAVNGTKGVFLDFSAGDITITRINDSYIHVTGSVDRDYTAREAGVAVVRVEANVANIDFVSLPKSVSQVGARVNVGQIIYSISEKNATVQYSVNMGSYRSPKEECAFCSGEVNIGENGIPVTITVNVGRLIVR